MIDETLLSDIGAKMREEHIAVTDLCETAFDVARRTGSSDTMAVVRSLNALTCAVIAGQRLTYKLEAGRS